jgi:cardiolipin synthase
MAAALLEVATGLHVGAYWLGIVLSVLGYLIPIALVPHVLLSRRDRGTTVAWIFLIVLVPYAGALAYWLVGHRRIARMERRAQAARNASRRLFVHAAVHDLEDPDLAGLARVARRSGALPPLGGNAIQVFDDNRACFDAQLEAIDGARRTIEHEVYIFRADALGRRFLAAFARAARRGVHVRVLVDGVGAFKLRARDVRALERAGARFLRFLPVLRPRLRPRINFRLHRKLLVVDDRTCFLGSLNVGDELVSADPPWREVHVKIEGPAAAASRETFEADWLFAGGAPRPETAAIPVAPAGGETVQLFASGPTEQVSATSRVLFSAIAMAREEVLLATPYFVPGRELLAALEAAALRGARVRIAIPGINDLALVQAAARYFVPWLREAGVEVRSMPRQMLHAKVAVIDRKVAIVGSANLDRRSLDLSFELNALVFGAASVARLRASAVAILAESEPYTAEPRTLAGRLVDAFARVLSPVL